MFGKKITRVMIVEGMSCEKCASRIEMALEKIKEVSKAKVKLENKEVIIELKKDIDNKVLEDTIENLDFEVVK